MASQQEAPKPRTGQRTKTVFAYIAIFFLAWGARVLIYNKFDERLGSESLKWVSGAAFHLGLMAAPAFLYLKFVDRARPLEYLKLNTNTAKGVLWGLAISVIFFAAYYLYFGLIRQAKVDWHKGLRAISLATLAEEVLFRGFILQKLREVTGFWRANLITAFLFAAIHWPGWILLMGKSAADVTKLSLSVFVLGLALGYLLKRFNSLWPCVFVHATNNFIAMIGLA
jgi:membrane protease YdiL (CAAX protease family)